MRYIVISIIIYFLYGKPDQLLAQTSFHRGVNLTEWFQADSTSRIDFSKYAKQDLINIKSLGCDVIRLPISMHRFTKGIPDYTFNPLYFTYLDSVITWAEQLRLYLILDNHSFDAAISSGPILLKVWKQMAEHYKNRSRYLLYEIFNEPHDISTADWGEIQQRVINAIRVHDTRHTIIVGGSNFNGYSELKHLPCYTDTNLIYTFHFYDPFLFTTQGAKWTGMEAISGIPFPYEAAKMPAKSDSLKSNLWLDSMINNYNVQGNVATIKSQIGEAITFRDTRKVKIYCGEFGVYIPKSKKEDRVYWYKVVRRYLNEKKIPWTIWDYQGGFGLFTKDKDGQFDEDLNIPLVRILDLNVPVQKNNGLYHKKIIGQ